MRTIAVIALGLLAACQTGSSHCIYKPGVNFVGKQAAVDQCKIASLREILQAMASDASGGYYNPRTQFSMIGNYTSCNRVGGMNIAPTATNYDANQGLRDG